MADLSTVYMGLALKSPLVASAGPLCAELDSIRAMEDAGLSAVVLHSLFEEQIDLESFELDDYLWRGAESSPEALSYLPDLSDYNSGPDSYLEHLFQAKQAVKIPVIASLNGVTTGGWVRFARWMEQAGADGIELNIYDIPTDVDTTGTAIEDGYFELVDNVKRSVRIPVAVKLGPYFSSMPNMARRLDEAGADALVLFNRFYQPDFNIETLDVEPHLVLSSSNELPLRLHWVAILFGRIRADMAVTGGVHTGLDVVKAMMAGARVAMTTSSLLRHGIGNAAQIEKNLVTWMEEHEYGSIRQMQGSMSYQNVAHPAAFERGNYMRTLSSYTQRTPLRSAGRAW